MATLKYCPGCEIDKSVNEFDLDLQGIVPDETSDGFLPLCRPCCSIYPFGYPEQPDGKSISNIYNNQGGCCYKCQIALSGSYNIRVFVGKGAKGANAFKLVCGKCTRPGDLIQSFERRRVDI